VEAGVLTIIVPATNLGNAEAALDMAERWPGVYATAGFHPHDASDATRGAREALNDLLPHPQIVAVGEIGLDFYRMLSPRETQIDVFESQLDMAAQHLKPVVIHCRDAWEEIAPILEAWSRYAMPYYPAGRPLGVLHYFSGTPDEAQRYHLLGYAISIHTSVTHPKAALLKEVARTAPLDALVIETDSPYGAPQSARGKRNEPAYVVEVARQIAELREIGIEEVAAASTENARRLFRLDQARPERYERMDGPELPKVSAAGGGFFALSQVDGSALGAPPP
jgi:TatD DNase family protein